VLKVQASATIPLSFGLAVALFVRPAQADLYKEERVAAFLSKTAPCYAWAFGVYRIGNGTVSPSVFCVFDGVRGEGGIKEKRGCLVTFYNVETDRYLSSLYQGRVPLPMVEEKCSDGAVKKLLSEYYVAGESLASATGMWSEELTKSVFGGPGADALHEAACKELRNNFHKDHRDRDREYRKRFATQQKLFCPAQDEAKKN